MEVRPEGLYCRPADCYIDPTRPVERALITHGHADHARSGHNHTIATPATQAIMAVRYGKENAKHSQSLPYYEKINLGSATIWFAPAGHILGSAQAVIEYENARIVISGDFKRSSDPTCAPFKPVQCDVFVTEATFGLPVFHHPDPEHEYKKLFDSLTLMPHRCHLVGAYALGKAQRVMLGLRALGWSRPFYLHGAMVKLCRLYEEWGFDFGTLTPVSEVDKKSLAGEIVLAPPSALADRWSRNLPDVLTCMASGWMQIRARAKQKLVELPLIISDHADWPELLQTLQDVAAPEIWVTHGRDDALVYQATKMGFKAQALSLLGYDDEEE
jgi:putative mRNA 3-end processing factor